VKERKGSKRQAGRKEDVEKIRQGKGK